MTPTEIVKSSHHFRIIMNVVKKRFPYVVGYEIDEFMSRYSFPQYMNLKMENQDQLQVKTKKVLKI